MISPELLRIERGPRTSQPLIVSIDSTARGPALGGCRITTYGSWQDGVHDALRLSAAMTHKTALADLPYGGGKIVVALSAESAEQFVGPFRRHLLADVGDIVASLGGRYITGPDVGTSPDDMTLIGHRTRHVLCRPVGDGGSGDSSGPTAAGVLVCIDAIRKHLFDNRPPSQLTFGIVGLGHVGGLIADHLAQQGAELVVADIDAERRSRATDWGAALASPDQVLAAEVDILVPAAVGGVISPETVPMMRCHAIVGPANNQLTDDSVADLLHASGITWAPDQVVSAGGVIAATSREIEGLPAPEVDARIEAIGHRLAAILEEARESNVPPLSVAKQLADSRLSPRDG